MRFRAALVAGLQTKRGLWTVVALFLVPRCLVVLLDVTPTSDAAWYFDRAVEWLAGHGYAEDGVPTAYWPPGWPMTLTAAFKTFGAGTLTVRGINFVFACLGGWLTYDLARRLFDSEVAGRAALLLLAIYPNSFGYIPLALTEVSYTTVLLALCWILVLRPGLLARAFAGILLGYASLIKAQSIVFVPLFFAVWWLRGERTSRRLLDAALQGALVVIVAACVVVPWTLRNARVLGAFVPISTNGGLTLLTGNNPTANGDFTQDDPMVTSIRGPVSDQVAIDKLAKARAAAWIRENPGTFLKLLPLKVFRLWAPDGEAEWGYQAGWSGYDEWWWLFRGLRAVNQLFYAALLLGFAYAGYRLASGRDAVSGERTGWWLLPFGVAAYPTLIAMVFSGQSRFHFPAMPFVIMTVAWLITRPRDRAVAEPLSEVRDSRPNASAADIDSAAPTRSFAPARTDVA